MSQNAPSDRDDLRAEHDFSAGVRGKHHEAYRRGTNVVFLDPDVAEVFKDSAAVNTALRLLLTLARTGRQEVTRRTSRFNGLVLASLAWAAEHARWISGARCEPRRAVLSLVPGALLLLICAGGFSRGPSAAFVTGYPEVNG